MSACPTLLPGTVNNATSRPECGILIRPTRIEETARGVRASLVLI